MEDNKKVIICGVNLGNSKDFEYSMQELKSLCDACNQDVIGELIQNSDEVSSTHYLGKGKLEELSKLIKEKDADTVVFSDELSPSQIRNIESRLNCFIMDRTNLILDIFANRAKTRESKLQVEIAMLQYMLPHLIGSRANLGRQSGGSGSGNQNKGIGETKLELDRRKINERIAMLKKELDRITKYRVVQRNLRKKNNTPIVSLVGYTNSGKSTIMNSMVDLYTKDNDKKVFEENMLFATLETSVRQIKLKDNKTFLLTDTVGFIDKLPTKLIKAFRSTLEEILEADLIIHVVDYSNSHYKEQINITDKTLEDIGVSKDTPVIYAYNKSDLTNLKIPMIDGSNIYMSARQKIGMDEFVDLIKKKLFSDYVECKLLIPYNQGNIVSYLMENSKVLSNEHLENGTFLHLECKKEIYEKYIMYKHS